jgi:hypothetical protein
MISIKKNMGGKMPEATFTRMSFEASMYIKKNTYGRIDKDNIPDEVKYCTCSIADKMQKIEKRNGKNSESVGSWSVNYQESSDNEKELYDTLVNYLLDVKDSKGISLLYRGC